jgi:CRISPR-associated protein Csx10
MPLQQLTYTIRLLSPVLITGSVGDENIITSEDYLTGTALLGMFANLYLQKAGLNGNAHTDPDFKSWFLSGDLRFLNGYKCNDQGRRALPVPLSLQFLKSGEITPVDLLFADSAAPTKHHAGYCLLQDGSFEQVAVNMQINFHHQRTNPLVGRSLNSEIFNYESINPAQAFVAGIIGEQADLEKFRDRMGRRVFYGRLGRSKSTQYGKVEIDFLHSAIGKINETRPGDNGVALQEDEPIFTLTLLSHLILPNEYGQASASVPVLQDRLRHEFKAEGLALTESQLILERSFARTVDIENYLAVWKARRPAAAALCKGSCFRFRLAGLERSALQNAGLTLRRLQEQGLGLRRNEGFGRLAINWQTEEKLKNVTKERETEQRKKLGAQPEAEPPEMAKQIFRATLRDHLAEQARQLAMQKLEMFASLPSGALISRLQSLAERAQSEQEFKSLMARLRDTAKAQLRRCRAKDNSQTLLEFLESTQLTGEEGEVQALLSIALTKDEASLCKVISYDPAADTDLRNKLFKLYFSTFFALMRKGINQ